ncbi:MAG: hypothetical protein QOE92_1308, partial [Chloroflexota bacterium]|nr:hypothetical protein [Chloroflexota bacterium]
LFETYPPVPPGNVLPPPLDEDGPPPSSLPVAADADTVDVQVAGTVPDDFKAFIAAASAGGVADYDKLYADADFNFTNEARASRIPVLITTDRAPFTALANVQQFRSGFVDPCFNHAADAAGCEPRVMILFDPAQWKGGDYPPMSRPRVEHELFHVAHQKLLKKLRLGNLFQAPGYFWQTEGFATFTQRQVPDFEAYQSFPANILNQGFFSWPKITDGRYESAYEASSFLDEMVFQSGNDPKLLTRWIKATRAGDPSSLSLMSTIAGSGESIDIDRFQELYVRSVTDFYAPGFLPKIDGRTVGVAVPDAYKAEKTVAEKDFTPAATPVSVDAAMAPLSSRLFRVGVAGLPKEDSAKVRLSLSADRADGLRGVVLVLRGDNDKNLPFCYRQIGDSPPDAMAAGATRCFKDNARVAGVIGAGGGKVDVTVGSLKKFSPDVSKLSFVVVGFNLLTSVSAGLTPAKARLTVSQPFGNLDLTLSGSITGHAFAEQDFNPDCKLDNRGGIGLTVSWLKVHLGDQTITFDFSIYPWPGPGRHKVYTEIDNASIGTVSSNSWYENEKPESFAVFAPDKQTVTFDTNMTTYGKPTDPKVHATGTFVCAKPIA